MLHLFFLPLLPQPPHPNGIIFYFSVLGKTGFQTDSATDCRLPALLLVFVIDPRLARLGALSKVQITVCRFFALKSLARGIFVRLSGYAIHATSKLFVKFLWAMLPYNEFFFFSYFIILLPELFLRRIIRARLLPPPHAFIPYHRRRTTRNRKS